MVLYACKNLEYNQNGHTFECMSNVYLAERCSHKYAVTAAGHHVSLQIVTKKKVNSKFNKFLSNIKCHQNPLFSETCC